MAKELLVDNSHNNWYNTIMITVIQRRTQTVGGKSYWKDKEKLPKVVSKRMGMKIVLEVRNGATMLKRAEEINMFYNNRVNLWSHKKQLPNILTLDYYGGGHFL